MKIIPNVYCDLRSFFTIISVTRLTHHFQDRRPSVSLHYNADYKELDINSFETDTIIAKHHLHDNNISRRGKNKFAAYRFRHYLPLKTIGKLPRGGLKMTVRGRHIIFDHWRCANININFKLHDSRFAPLAKFLMAMLMMITSFPISRHRRNKGKIKYSFVTRFRKFTLFENGPAFLYMIFLIHGMVGTPGLEPGRLIQPTDFKSVVFTNFTMPPWYGTSARILISDAAAGVK